MLRTLCRKSILEIKQAAQAHMPIMTIEPFSTDWESDKTYLVRLKELLNGQTDIPLAVYEGDITEDANVLSAEAFNHYLGTLREIELEQQRQNDLETGYIVSPDAFQPHDQDWF